MESLSVPMTVANLKGEKAAQKWSIKDATIVVRSVKVLFANEI